MEGVGQGLEPVCKTIFTKHVYRTNSVCHFFFFNVVTRLGKLRKLPKHTHHH